MAGFGFGTRSAPLEVDFSNVSIVVITHNLGYKPFIYIITDDNEQSFCDINYDNDNQVTLTFQNSLTGTAYIR